MKWSDGAPAPVFITGAASGIGAATAELAAERGFPLIICDVDEAAVRATGERALELGSPAVESLAVDVRDPDQIKAAFDAGVAAVGLPNAAVCCAGVDRGGPSHEMDRDVLDRIVDVNFKGTFYTCTELARRLLEAGEKGAIVCVSSIAASIGLPEASVYCASKGAVSGMVRAMGVEYADRGIRVNALAPGATETPLMWANVENAEMEKVKAEVDSVVPMGRLAAPREQAQVALWLLSDEASYITGSHITVDGGVLATSVLPT